MSSADPSRDLVFISYSHANPTWRDRLLVLLKPFVRQGRLQVWADPYIEAGSVWRREIDAALARTRVGVVLLTPDLLASDFVADVELPHLLRAANTGALTLLVVPVEAHAAGSTRFSDGDLSACQWAWDPQKPLAGLKTDARTRALVMVANAVVGAAGAVAQDADLPAAVERQASVAPQQGGLLGALHGVPTLPPHHLARNDAHESLKQALLGTSQVVGVSASETRVGLHGEGGVGKTVAAQGVVMDEDIRRAFPEGIYWITLGQQPKIEALQAWLAEFFGERAAIEDVGAGVRLLRDRLQGRACLVVLDDVWQLTDARAFDALDGAGRLLVTTRDRSILTALGARDLRLNRLSPELALNLLAEWAAVPAATLPPSANQIAKEVAYLPLALSLAGAQVREGTPWADVLAALREGDLVFLDHPYGSVFKSMQASVNALEPFEAERYVELAVFPEDMEVPVAVVEELWRATSAWESSRVRALLTRLAARNLIRLGKAGVSQPPQAGGSGADTGTAVSLHDLQHDFVRLLVKDLAALHGQLVDAWRATLAPMSHDDMDEADRWASLSPISAYRWGFLAYHLRGACREAALEALLTNPDWLYARMTRFSVQSLLADYEGPPLSPALRSVRDALVLSAHVLTRDVTAVTEQLAGRLWNSPETAVQALIMRRPRPLWDRARLRPVMACLTPAGGPLRRTMEGHAGSVTGLAVLPDGQQALSGSRDGTLKLWDLTTGTAVQTLRAVADSVTAVTLLSEGRRALSGSSDGTLRLWDLTTGVVVRTLVGHAEPVTALTVLPNGQRALSGSEDFTLKLWDLTTGAVLQTLVGYTDWVTGVAVLPDGQQALSAGYELSLRLWDLTTGAVVQTLEGHADSVTEVAILPDGRRALSGSDDGTLKLWDLATGAVLETLEDHTGYVRALAVLPDGQRALSGTGNGTLTLWDLTTGAVLQRLEGEPDWVTALAVLPDGARALSGSNAGALRVWDLTTETVRQKVERHAGSVSALALLPNGEQALSGSEDLTLKLWDLTTGAVLQTLEGHAGRVTGVAVLPDGRRALSSSSDGTLKLWDLTTGVTLGTLVGHTRGVSALALMPDGQRALSGGTDGTLKLWDLTTGMVLLTLEGHTRTVRVLAALPDGQRALTGSMDRTLKVWDLTTGAVLQTLQTFTRYVRALAMLPDGQRALSGGSEDSLQLWDLTTGQILQWLQGHSRYVTAVVVLPDGQRALSGSDDHTLKLWDMTTGTVRLTLEGHAGRVTAVAVLPDGLRAVSGSKDSTVKLWDLGTGRALCTFYDDAAPTGITITPDGVTIVVWNELGRVYTLKIE